MLRIPRYWTEHWGKLEWLRKWLIKYELAMHGEDTMCEHGRFSSSWYCDCDD